jgi:hypothetical protein
MKSVFCDESGFTGENLWQSEQPYFVYSAVAISEEEAAEVVESTRRAFAIRARELHAAQILKRANGRKVLRSVLEKIAPLSSVAIFNKRYALAGKMFEYLIEPAISRANSIFYNIGFHKFVANGLYLGLLAEPSNAEQAFQDFQKTVRTGDLTCLEGFLSAMARDGMDRFFGQIATVVACNRPAIESEIAGNEDGARAPRWILELTSTALMSLMADLSGDEMVPLSVTCDESKPLLSQAEMFHALVRRTDCHQMAFDGRINQITFNLAHEIRLAQSTDVPGLQLADLVAGAAAFALKRPEDEFSRFWQKSCSEMVHRNSVLPEVDEFDITTERATVNAFVLAELVERSMTGRDLIQGMPQFIRFARVAARRFLLEQQSSAVID